jgi:hypothetical protein
VNSALIKMIPEFRDLLIELIVEIRGLREDLQVERRRASVGQV